MRGESRMKASVGVKLEAKDQLYLSGLEDCVMCVRVHAFRHLRCRAQLSRASLCPLTPRGRHRQRRQSLADWFNVGLLHLQPISWTESPAVLLVRTWDAGTGPDVRARVRAASEKASCY